MANPYLQRLEMKIVKGYLRGGRQKRPPVTINVEPTNRCNLACPICPHGAAHAGLIPPLLRPSGAMEMETFDQVLVGCKPQIREIALYLHGEPYLNPRLAEMVKKAGEQGYGVTIHTNGLVLTEAMVHETLLAAPKLLAVSMDLISAAGYMKYKGKDEYGRALDQMKMIVAGFAAHGRTRTQLALRTIYNGEDRDRTLAFLDHWLGQPPVKSIQMTNAFPWPRRKDADLLASHLLEDRDPLCPQLYNALNVLWDGRVTPCSFDYDGEYIIGDVHHDPVDAIVNSSEARRFRKLHLLGKRGQLPLCRDCLIPRYRFEMIAIHRGRYLELRPQEKDDLYRRIHALNFNPAEEFENPGRAEATP